MSYRLSIAPMMDWTDRHDRYFLRLIAPDILLYTEMITAQAIAHGDVPYLLGFDDAEHPVALQLGGSDPSLLANAAKLGQEFGYDEINLNVGCPSPRVSSGRFGACLMLEPALMATCVSAMRNAVTLPVTVKCRIGVDNHDSYAELCTFIQTVANAGCQTFIIHARKAWLNGLSPKENREIPPLQYDVVYQLKRDFPQLNLILNGGLKSLAAVDTALQHVDGVMIGREAYHNPYWLAALQANYHKKQDMPSRHTIAKKMLPYVRQQLENGVRLNAITRHMLGLFQGQPGAAKWRRYISEEAHKNGADETVIERALELVPSETSWSVE